METLTIISTQISVMAEQTINGNTASFAWNYNQGHLPKAVNFNVQRGIVGEDGFTGNNIITGAFYPEVEKLDVQNNNFQEGDFVLYQNLLTTCKGIITDLQAL